MLSGSDHLLAMATLWMKVLHIAALCVWVAGLVVIVILMRTYRPGMSGQPFVRFRKLTHYGYIRMVTPAAVIAIGAGIALILLRWIFDPWLLIKLVLVCGLAILHGFVGHMIAMTAKTAGEAKLAPPMLVMGGVLCVSAVIFWIVLAKPDVNADLPQWMTEPQSLPVPAPPMGGVSQSEASFGRMVPI